MNDDTLAKIHPSHKPLVDPSGWTDVIRCDRCCRILIMDDGRRTVASAKSCAHGTHT